MPDTPQDKPGAPASPPFTAIDMLEAYSAALDEVWRLRRALAYEARVVEVHTLDLKALSKGRRSHLERSIERLRDSARGNAEVVYAGTNSRSLESEIERVGGSNKLTRNMWEATLIERKRPRD